MHAQNFFPQPVVEALANTQPLCACVVSHTNKKSILVIRPGSYLPVDLAAPIILVADPAGMRIKNFWVLPHALGSLRCLLRRKNNDFAIEAQLRMVEQIEVVLNIARREGAQILPTQ